MFSDRFVSVALAKLCSVANTVGESSYHEHQMMSIESLAGHDAEASQGSLHQYDRLVGETPCLIRRAGTKFADKEALPWCFES